MRALFIMLSAAILFSGCTHNITLKTTPPGASVTLKEIGGDKTFDLGASPVKKQVTAAGDYYLIITKPGYAPLKERVELTKVEETFDFTLTPAYVLAITSEPAGASISMEDLSSEQDYSLGEAPVNYTIESKGPFRVHATLPGYEEKILDVSPKAGETEVPVKVTLTKKGAAAEE